MSGSKMPNYELRIRAKSGDYKIGEFTPSAIKDGDKIIGTLGVARDITERKQAEEELQKS